MDTKLRVLLIEDDEDDFVMIRDMLEQPTEYVYDLQWAKDYYSGIEAVGRGEYDVCLLDYRLRKYDGLKLLQEAVASGCKIPIIFITGQGNHEIDMEAIRNGAADYLVKEQITAALLNRSILHAIERKEAEEKLRKSEEKYKTLLENLPQRIFLKDRKSVYISCNGNYARDLKIKPEEIAGRTDYDFYDRELAEKYRADDKRIMDSGKMEEIEEKYVLDGQEVIVQTVKTPLKGDKDDIVEILGIFWDITERKRAEAELKAAQEKLIEIAHRAGMAEVAADILHNVGNVLNSINVSTTVIREKVAYSELANLVKVASIINEHTDDIGTFLTEHPQGKHIPVYLTEVSKCLQDEQTDIIGKLRGLADNVQHIKDIVSTQQSYAKVSGVEVQTSISKLAEDAIQINSAGLECHGTQLIREFEELGDIEIDKQKLLQILVNLINNAKYALSDSSKEEKLLTIRIYKHCDDRFRIEVADNGVGISEDNLTKIFSHGFTTKEHGHGFGLHSSALAAKEMGGSLTVYSEGVGQGAMFTLELPFKPVEVIK